MGSLDTLPRTAGGKRQHNAASGENGHLDWACKRQRDGGKHESVAMRPTLARADEKYRATATQSKTAEILFDNGCRDRIMTNIEAFLNFVLNQSVVRNANREVERGCMRISIHLDKGEIQCELKNVLCDYSSNFL